MAKIGLKIPLKLKKIRWMWDVTRMEVDVTYKRHGEMRRTYKILVDISQRKMLFGRRRSTYEENINMDIWEVGCDIMDWMKWLRKWSSAWLL
jgi:hypothetical protein